ncbi:tetratricopeptide repeat protein [Brachyspira hyodysenteriae]|nr:tetratricopeptide repeat protein [Brachyspira hyodysenteriae]
MYEEAIKDFDKVIELNPNDESAYFNQSIIKIKFRNI